MSCYSPRAYQYLREKFNNKLPHPSTLRKWFANSDIRSEPGILPEAMKSLQNLAQKRKAEGHQMLVSLAQDEVSIKRHIQWLHQEKKLSGFVTETTAKGEFPVASDVLVFMATVLGANVSIPIAYYCVVKMDGVEKTALLHRVLNALFDIEVKVASITFDGLPANLSMCRNLGACFDVANPVPYIFHPVDKSKIYIIFDPCHMFKLIRSTLGDFGVIHDTKLGNIDWQYFQRLVTYREKNGFVTHRLNKHHILYHKNRMNVRLAAETFSNSVASSMDYLRKSGDKNYKHSKATSNFTSIMNKLFDIFNSKRVKNGEIFKSAINETNARIIFDFFEEAIEYIKRLRLKGKLCVFSRRHTGFVGFIINMMSAKHIYEEYVLGGCLENLPLFFNGQDVLESFFSRIRAQLGCNDNPNVQEFKAAMRKLLFLNEISSSVFANCEDNLNILTVSSVGECYSSDIRIGVNNECTVTDEEEIPLVQEDSTEVEQIRLNVSNLNSQEATIAFIAGTIEQKIASSRFDCKECRTICLNAFVANEKIQGSFTNNSKTQRPCESTFIICKFTHEIFEKNLNFEHFNYQDILKLISEALFEENLFRKTNFSHDYEHKDYFVGFIVDEYVRSYATYIAQNLTLEQQQILLRQYNRKITHFQGL